MRTRTIIYRDTDYAHLDKAIDYMAHESGWAVRQVEVLEPVHEIQRSNNPDTVPVTVSVLTVLVVYEREKEDVRRSHFSSESSKGIRL